MLKFVSNKSIFDYNDVEYIVNPVNCVGVMGKGLAKQFKEKYPGMFEVYKKSCASGKIKIGCLYIVPAFSTEEKRGIVLFPTKKHWKDKSRLEYIEAGLNYLVLSLSRENVKLSIAIPKIGCGLGGLDWENQVRPLMINKLSRFKDNKDINIIIVE